MGITSVANHMAGFSHNVAGTTVPFSPVTTAAVSMPTVVQMDPSVVADMARRQAARAHMTTFHTSYVPQTETLARRSESGSPAQSNVEAAESSYLSAHPLASITTALPSQSDGAVGIVNSAESSYTQDHPLASITTAVPSQSDGAIGIVNSAESSYTQDHPLASITTAVPNDPSSVAASIMSSFNAYESTVTGTGVTAPTGSSSAPAASASSPVQDSGAARYRGPGVATLLSLLAVSAGTVASAYLSA